MSIDEFDLADLTIRGVPVPDNLGRVPSGFYAAKDGLSGLFGGVKLRGAEVARTTGHGDFPTSLRYGARVSGWKIHTVAHSRRERADLDLRLAGLGDIDAVNEFDVRIQMDGLVLHSRARCDEAPDPVPERHARRGGLWVSTAEFSLIHADPFWYGNPEPQPPAQYISFRQLGTVEAWPTLIVHGAGSAYRVVTADGGSGGLFVMETPLPVGATDTIDTATGIITRSTDGVIRSGFYGTFAAVRPNGAGATYMLYRHPIAASEDLRIEGTCRPTYV